MFSPAYAIRSVGRSVCERRRTWSIGLAMMPIRSVVRSFDDANVALCRIAQDSECGLVAGAVISSNRLGEAVELDQYGALFSFGTLATILDTAGELTAGARRPFRPDLAHVLARYRGCEHLRDPRRSDRRGIIANPGDRFR